MHKMIGKNEHESALIECQFLFDQNYHLTPPRRRSDQWKVGGRAIVTFQTPKPQIRRARLAQSVEHETLNLRVVDSSPTLGENIFPLF